MNASHGTKPYVFAALAAMSAMTLVACFGPPAPTPIEVGTQHAGEITESSPMNEEGYRFERVAVEMTPGTAYYIDATSTAFDTVIEVTPPGEEPTVMEDDDGHPEGTNSRLRVEAVEGEYVILVRGLTAEVAGAFNVLVHEAPRPDMGPATIGQEGNAGELSADFPAGLRGNPAQVWTLTAEEGTGYDISMVSDDFDTYLTVVPPGVEAEDSNSEGVMNNDDGGEGLNSHLRFVAEAAGDYAIQATTFSGGASGAYTLTVTTYEPPRANMGPATIGEPNAGVLSPDFPPGTVRQSSPAQIWTVDLTAGQTVQIDMIADYDTYLAVIPPGEGATPLTDDDGGEGLNAQLTFTAEAAGTYTIQATSYSSGPEGPYTLTITPQ